LLGARERHYLSHTVFKFEFRIFLFEVSILGYYVDMPPTGHVVANA